MSSSSTMINVRAPSTGGSASSSSSKGPSARQGGGLTMTGPAPEWLQGTWHVTHSTLPIWKTKRNVRITYTLLPDSTTSGTTKLLDVVTYQTQYSEKPGILRGIDTSVDNTGSRWNWRGKGWLSVASSRWEILGHGEYVDVRDDGEEIVNRWVVTYFSASLFSPAGMDFYSMDEAGLKGEVVWDIKQALNGLGDGRVRKLVSKLFRVKHDTSRDI